MVDCMEVELSREVADSTPDCFDELIESMSEYWVKLDQLTASGLSGGQLADNSRPILEKMQGMYCDFYVKLAKAANTMERLRLSRRIDDSLTALRSLAASSYGVELPHVNLL